MPETQTRTIVNYTVVADAIVLQTDDIDPQTRKPIVSRAVKGQTFDAYDDDPRVATFRAMKSIRPTKDVTGKEHITAATIQRAFQNDGEYSGPVIEEVTPLDGKQPVEGDALLATS
jgi:hypothetical protein